jgi:hypothetical protein
MQRMHARWAALAAVTSAARITSSCTSASSDTPRSPRVRVTVDSRCPDTLGGAKDVSNPPGGLGNHLVPTGDDPRAGLVCQYAGSQHLKTPTTTVLARSTALSQQSAARLAQALANISLRAPTGKFPVPGRPRRQHHDHRAELPGTRRRCRPLVLDQWMSNNRQRPRRGVSGPEPLLLQRL